MSARSRCWLKSFLHLDAEAARRSDVTAKEVTRQEDTVLQALDVLEREPGVVFADEVGMGKTFEALGLIACYRRQNPESRVLVISPGPDLNQQWVGNVARFRESGFFPFPEADCGSVDRLEELNEAVKAHPIVFAPVNVFMGGRAGAENAFLIAAFLRWGRLREESRKQIASILYGSRRSVPDVADLSFMANYSYDELRRHDEEIFSRAFLRQPEEDSDEMPEQAAGLMDIYNQAGPEGFENSKLLTRALARARFQILNRLLPDFDLLVVDEAHKLKNPYSLRAQAVSSMLFKKYRKTAFLTATPFQLSIQELEQVFRMFSYAQSAPPDFLSSVRNLFADITMYQQAYDVFGRDWRQAEADVTGRFDELYRADRSLGSPVDDLRIVRLVQQVRELRRLKEQIEPQFRRWMIRSPKNEKYDYRQEFPNPITPRGEERLPFLVYERMIAELFRQGDTTYKAAVEINLASSYEATLAGNLFDQEREIHHEVDAYRQLLKKLLPTTATERENHPKVAAVVGNAYLAAVTKREKTLIFCDRVETIRTITRAIEGLWLQELFGLWRRVFPEATEADVWGGDAEGRGRHHRYQARFRQGRDSLYLALRENYLHSIAEITPEATPPRDQIVGRANQILAGVRASAYAAENLDYRIAKRCIEQATVKLMQERGGLRDDCPFLKNILNDDFVANGLDLVADEEEGDAVGDTQPRWVITEKTLDHMLPGGRRGIWWHLRSQLRNLDPDKRVRLAEAVASFFTRKEVAFLPELLAEVKAAGRDPTNSDDVRDTLEAWWGSPSNSWRMRLEQFVGVFLSLNASRQSVVLEEALKTGDFVRHTIEGDTRERLKEAFNTPFYPMVLVGNQVMQEGIDLHEQCRRVVHHDLSWNPAQLEQRVGRVDRIGSLVRRRRAADGGQTKLEIHVPYLERTIDVRQYQVVKEREKWLEILLGAPPLMDDHDPNERTARPLPEELVQDLRIRLEPRSA
jgi:hypothetical protein